MQNEMFINLCVALDIQSIAGIFFIISENERFCMCHHLAGIYSVVGMLFRH